MNNSVFANFANTQIEYRGTPLNILLEDQSLKKGQSANLIFKLKDDSEISAYQLGIWFSPQDIEILSGESHELEGIKNDDTNFGLTTATRGEFRTIWIDPKAKRVSFKNGKKLFKVKVKAKKDIKSLKGLVELRDKILENVSFDETGNAIKLSLVLESTANFVEENNQIELLSSYPSPSKNEFFIRYNASVGGKVKIAVQDIQGRLIEMLEQESVTGINELSLEKVNTYPKGVLIYTIQSESNTVSGKFIKH